MQSAPPRICLRSSSVTYTVSGTLSPTATGTLSNTARVITPASGVSDPTDLARTGAGNNSATESTTINSVPDLQINKSHAGNFTVGVNGTYTLTANNAGTASTSATITVTDNLPAGLTIAATSYRNRLELPATVVGSSTATCTRASIAGGASAPAITVTVVVGAAAFPSVTNVATVSGGGEPASNNFNNSDSDPTTVNGVPDLTVNKSHVGNFTQGQVGATYTITATNSGYAGNERHGHRRRHFACRTYRHCDQRHRLDLRARHAHLHAQQRARGRRQLSGHYCHRQRRQQRRRRV